MAVTGDMLRDAVAKYIASWRENTINALKKSGALD